MKNKYIGKRSNNMLFFRKNFYKVDKIVLFVKKKRGEFTSLFPTILLAARIKRYHLSGT